MSGIQRGIVRTELTMTITLVDTGHLNVVFFTNKDDISVWGAICQSWESMLCQLLGEKKHEVHKTISFWS